jgi:hypothetical protein
VSHTPGTWTLISDKTNLLITTPEFNIARVFHQDGPFGCNSLADCDYQCRANARLIAAAPDLLAACQRMLTHHKATCNALGEYCTGDDADCLGLLKDAIAKATGAN